MAPTFRCTYLLPLRRTTFNEIVSRDLASYFGGLRRAGCELVVVDGSPPEIFAQHHQLWRDHARHVEVDRRFGFLNDKVNGIQTGVRLSSCEKVILADDDIRYTAADVDRMCELLERAQVVRPQNFLNPARRWWALTESARMLVNRAVLRTADYPGTCSFQRETFLRNSDYDGDVLFDNEEIIRHFARAGAAVAYANDFFIAKVPPSFRKWVEQRPRQAYEDFPLRAKTVIFASIAPALFCSALFSGFVAFCGLFLLITAASIGVAMTGQLRGQARGYFGFHIPFYAPLWVLERSFSTWWAFYWHLRHGGYPFGDKLLSKGVGRDWVEGGKIAARVAASQRPL